MGFFSKPTTKVITNFQKLKKEICSEINNSNKYKFVRDVNGISECIMNTKERIISCENRSMQLLELKNKIINLQDFKKDYIIYPKKLEFIHNKNDFIKKINELSEENNEYYNFLKKHLELIDFLTFSNENLHYLEYRRIYKIHLYRFIIITFFYDDLKIDINRIKDFINYQESKDINTLIKKKHTKLI